MGKVTTLQNPNDDASCYVRVTDSDHRGNVEFQFSISDPSLYLEMTLPKAAFDEFCREHLVRTLSEEEGAQVDADKWRWRFGDDEQE